MTEGFGSSVEAAAGNARVVDMLRVMLSEAEKGEVGWGAAVIGWWPNNVKIGMEGMQTLEHLGEHGLAALYDSVKRSKENRTLPERDAALDASYACYNMPALAVSYDFLTWLIDAEMTRRREGAPEPLKVHIWQGRDGNWPALQHVAGYRAIFNQVMRAAIPLIGGGEDERAALGRAKEFAVPFDIVAAARAGEAVPRFRSTFKAQLETSAWLGKHGIDPKRYVTITLRESPQWPHRNSNIPAWKRFAKKLGKDGVPVVIVRDTAKMLDKPLGPWPECALAAAMLDRRLALYEGAQCNLLVANGPVDLLLYTHAPWLCFTDIKPDGHAYVSDTPGFWKARKGVEVGGQYPWSADNQRIVWSNDDYANIIKAWENFCA